MASPLIDPGRVWYPISGSGGWGVASAAGMRLLSEAFQSASPIDLSPENAFLASIDQAAPSLKAAMSCRIPGVHQFALLPLADAVVDPPDATLPFPSVVVLAFHGGVIESASGARLVADVLSHAAVQRDPVLDVAARVIRSAASPWRVPDLVLSDYPHAPGASRQLATCSALRTLGG
jgi:hypothetical protein